MSKMPKDEQLDWYERTHKHWRSWGSCGLVGVLLWGWDYLSYLLQEQSGLSARFNPLSK